MRVSGLTCYFAESRARLATLGLVLDATSEGANKFLFSAGKYSLPQLTKLLSEIYLAEEIAVLSGLEKSMGMINKIEWIDMYMQYILGVIQC